MEKLVELILAALEQEHLSLEEFARRAGVSPKVIRLILLERRVEGNAENKFGLLASVLTSPDTGQKFSGWVSLADYCGLLEKKESFPPELLHRFTVRTWYGWVQSGSGVYCYRFDLDSTGSITSTHVSDSYCK